MSAYYKPYGFFDMEKYLITANEYYSNEEMFVTPKKVNKKEQYAANKFYIGSNSALDRNWGHATVEEAIAHAQKIVNGSNDREDEVFIVQIVKVVKKQQAPVVVEDV